MKKLILFCILSIGLLVSLSAQEIYTVQTSKGEQQVIVPDGLTSTDVMLRLAAAYYELSWAYDDLELKAAQLSETAETYIQENQQLRENYRKLQEDYKALTALLEAKAKVQLIRPLLGGGLQYSPGCFLPTLYIGAELFEKVGVLAAASLLNQKLVFGVSAVIAL